MDLETFERLVHSRRATRHFKPEALPPDLLRRLIDAARWAPSGYNLQPTHFVAVTDAAVKARLRRACMNQRPVTEASAVVVLAGDTKAAASHFADVLAADKAADALSADYEKLLRRVVPLSFDQGPAGIGWIWKALLVPPARLLTPIPSIPAAHGRFWATKQVMLCAMNFMLAATAAGCATLPMEGFDEGRVKGLLRIPRKFVVPVVIAVGYSAVDMPKRSRLPLERVLHENGW